MDPHRKPIAILMADDDEEDRMLASDALEEAKLMNPLGFVKDGEELMRYLRGNGEYADREKYPLPGLILLDLNMPRKDGREALREIKENPDLRTIPVVVMTTSRAEEDIVKSYHLGVSGYITKPVSFEGLVNIMKALSLYWFEIVKLPGNGISEQR